ncbi:MAG: DUF4197 domain-containing protein [Pseudomonadota bacterium]
MRFLLAAVAIAGLSGCETGAVSGFGNVVEGVLSSGGDTLPGGLTTAEIDAGLREALTLGTERVSAQLGETDGFFGDNRIRIPLPDRLADLQDQLSQVGLSAPLDDLELRINRAAEASMPEAQRLVISAVRSITVEDALAILNGGNTAATDFLRDRTEASLTDAFRPYVDSALADSGAIQAFDSVTSRYGLARLSNDLRSDISDDAVALGLDGLFYYVGKEERRIRENPVARTSELLRKVFGSVQ